VEVDVLRSIENVIGSDEGDVIVGSDEVNVLDGSGGDDLLRGEGGDDVLIGGEGADVFVFEAGDGTDTIVDFEAGVDRIEVSDLGSDFDLASAATQDGDDVVISFGNDTAARLQNVQLDELTNDDFVA
ncbi:MAG: calcium-binding protein, partial [Planctomycetota bacterium]